MKIDRLQSARSYRITVPTWRHYALLAGLLVALSGLLMFEWDNLVWYFTRGYSPPPAATASPLPDDVAVVAIGKDGVVRVSDGEKRPFPISSEEELAEAVASVAAEYPGRPFILKADGSVAYSRVQSVLATMQAAEVSDVFFQTRPPLGGP